MLTRCLFQHARAKPQDVAVSDFTDAPGASSAAGITWLELAARAVALSKYIRQQTDRPTVGILLPSSSAFVVSFYATLLAGKAAVPMNFLLGQREIGHIIQDSGIDTVLSAPPLSEKLAGVPLKIVDLTKLPQQTPPSAGDFENPHVAAPDALATILYTSGTSGLPKGVCLNHGHVQSNVEACIQHVFNELSGKDHTFLGIVPLFHSTGLLATMVAPMQLGCRAVYVPRFSANRTVEAIEHHKITVMAAIPSMYGMMIRLKEATPAQVASLEVPLSGGEPLPGRVREGFEQRFGKPLFEGYGLTENCGPIAVNKPSAHRPGSVGRPLPGDKVRITDPDGNAVAVGQEGEIQLAGPMVFSQYHNAAEQSDQSHTPDGYFRTGDVGHLDDDGYLFVTGRIKDMIKVAGEQVYPREIEEVLSRHPGVGEAAVVGQPDENRGEVVAVFAIPAEGQQLTLQDLQQHCRNAGLPTFKLPKHLYIVQELPRSPTGKVLRRELRDKLQHN